MLALIGQLSDVLVAPLAAVFVPKDMEIAAMTSRGSGTNFFLMKGGQQPVIMGCEATGPIDQKSTIYDGRVHIPSQALQPILHLSGRKLACGSQSMCIAVEVGRRSHMVWYCELDSGSQGDVNSKLHQVKKAKATIALPEASVDEAGSSVSLPVAA